MIEKIKVGQKVKLHGYGTGKVTGVGEAHGDPVLFVQVRGHQVDAYEDDLDMRICAACGKPFPNVTSGFGERNHCDRCLRSLKKHLGF